MRFATMLFVFTLAACTSTPPSPVVIPSESQVERGSSSPAPSPNK